MPRRLSRTKRLLITTGAAIAAAGALPGLAAAAECAPSPTTQAFAAFGDANEYFLAPDGGFGSMWANTRRTPELVPDVNPINLAGNLTALRLDKDEAVISARFCVDRTMPHLRFVADSAGSGQLDVDVKLYAGGQVIDSSSGSVSPSDHETWAPSRTIDLKTSGMAVGTSAEATVTIRSQGTWLVDDVFIDPYRR